MTRFPYVQPARPVHWWAGENPMTWDPRIISIACDPTHAPRAQADYDPTTADAREDEVTCPECLNVIMRRRCLALEDVPGPLPSRCTMTPHVGLHSWEVAKSAKAYVRTQLDSPSGLLPVRVPGAALREQEESSGVVGPAESPEGLESAYPRIIERWPA